MESTIISLLSKDIMNKEVFKAGQSGTHAVLFCDSDTNIQNGA